MLFNIDFSRMMPKAQNVISELLCLQLGASQLWDMDLVLVSLRCRIPGQFITWIFLLWAHIWALEYTFQWDSVQGHMGQNLWGIGIIDERFTSKWSSEKLSIDLDSMLCCCLHFASFVVTTCKRIKTDKFIVKSLNARKIY